MSVKAKERKSSSGLDSLSIKEDKHRTSLSTLIDHIQLRSLTSYYSKEESLFKKRIDKLNLKFYLETEKYLNSGDDVEKCQDQLFLILFKQISLYLEEIERLNKFVREKNEESLTPKQKLEEWNKKEKDNLINGQTIKNLKFTIKDLEKRVGDFTSNEDRMKKEIESLKRQLSFHNDKLKFEMTMKKAEEMKNKGIKSNKQEIDLSKHTRTNSKEKSTKDLDTNRSELNISKIIKKKRNLSDNNPSPDHQSPFTLNSLNLNQPTYTQLTKKRCEENTKHGSGVEYNNININLNLHLKNSNNTNINVEIKSPVRTKSTITEHSEKGKLPVSDSKSKTATSSVNKKPVASNTKRNSIISVSSTSTLINTNSNTFTNANASRNSNTYANKNLRTFKKNLNLNEGSSSSPKQNSILKSPTFCSQFFNESKQSICNSNNNSLDIPGVHDIIQYSLQKYDEELIELAHLERILKNTKHEVINNTQNEDDNFKNDEFATILDFNNIFSNNYLSDNEEIVNNKSTSTRKELKTFTRSVNTSIINSPVIQPNATKKNYPLLTSVTIDLISNEGSKGGKNGKDEEETKAQGSTLNSTPSTLFSGNNIKVNKKRSESNKSSENAKVKKTDK